MDNKKNKYKTGEMDEKKTYLKVITRRKAKDRTKCQQCKSQPKITA